MLEELGHLLCIKHWLQCELLALLKAKHSLFPKSCGMREIMKGDFKILISLFPSHHPS